MSSASWNRVPKASPNYARTPAKVPESLRDQVRVVIGQLSDAEAIDHAVADADAVVSALGPTLEMTLLRVLRHTKFNVGWSTELTSSLLIHVLHPPVLDPMWTARWALLLRAGQSLLEPRLVTVTDGPQTDSEPHQISRWAAA
jgi:hypothetical protein